MKQVKLLMFRVVIMYTVFFVPSTFVHAQRTLKTILSVFIDIIDATIPLVMLVALLFFVFGAVRLIYGAGDDKSRNAGKQTLLWGTLALFCMVAIWGIVQIIQRTFFPGL